MNGGCSKVLLWAVRGLYEQRQLLNRHKLSATHLDEGSSNFSGGGFQTWTINLLIQNAHMCAHYWMWTLNLCRILTVQFEE